MFQQGKLKVCWTSIQTKKRKFSCVLYAHSQFFSSLARFDLANRGVRHCVNLSCRTLTLGCSYLTRH